MKTLFYDKTIYTIHLRFAADAPQPTGFGADFLE